MSTFVQIVSLNSMVLIFLTLVSCWVNNNLSVLTAFNHLYLLRQFRLWVAASEASINLLTTTHYPFGGNCLVSSTVMQSESNHPMILTTSCHVCYFWTACVQVTKALGFTRRTFVLEPCEGASLTCLSVKISSETIRDVLMPWDVVVVRLPSSHCKCRESSIVGGRRVFFSL